MANGGLIERKNVAKGVGPLVEFLRADFAIYGDRGVGTQELDERSHTLRYILSFNQAAIRHALERWERLALFARSFQNLMDQ